MKQLDDTFSLLHAVIHDEELQMKAEMGVEISGQQLMVLNYISKNTETIQRDVVTFLNRKAATVSVLLKNMEANGWIDRKVPDDNSRNKNIYLTKAGNELVQTYQLVQKRVRKQMLDGLTMDELSQLNELLQKVNN